MRVLAYRVTAEGKASRDNVCCGPSEVKKDIEFDNDSQNVRLRLTLNHAFSALVSMLSLTIRVWIGTHVSRSKPRKVLSSESSCVLGGCWTGTNTLKQNSPWHDEQRRRIECECSNYPQNLEIGHQHNVFESHIGHWHRVGSMETIWPAIKGTFPEKHCGLSSTLKNDPACPHRC